MRWLRPGLFVAGVLLVGYLVMQIGSQPIVEALSRLAWWQFALLCLPYAVIMAVDTLGWRYAFARDGAPFFTLLGARIAGDALNLVTAVASVGGEAIKAWLVRRHVSYEESVPSLIVAKTTSTVGQVLFLLFGVMIAELALDLDARLVRGMLWLLAIEGLAVGGFVLVQCTGVIARAGRLTGLLGVRRGPGFAERLDDSLRNFYRTQRRRLLLSTGFHFAGWVLGGVEVFLMLYALKVPLSLLTAVVVEAFGAGVRFASFLVPANIGVMEGANAGAFAALGVGAGAGLAFSLVRRARQAVWVALGLVILVAMRPRGWMASAPGDPGSPPSGRAIDGKSGSGNETGFPASRPPSGWQHER